MSEYQRYEFMTYDRPLTPEQLKAVDALSSHIEASSTHAIVEYHWGSFKHDPIKVLHKYFDGFLYWANWGTPRLAFRFPHGALSGDLIDGYDFGDYVTFTQHPDYDILDIHFYEMEAPDVWTEYELGSLIAIREELMADDLRSLYIVWLATQYPEDYDDEEEEDELEDNEEEEDELLGIPPVPPGFGKLTGAQQALAELVRVSEDLLAAAAQHSGVATPSLKDDFATWVERLPHERRSDYLVRLAHNEPGLSRTLVTELRALNQDKTKTMQPQGERVPYDTLYAESKNIKEKRQREKREQELLAHQRHLQAVHDHQDEYWRQVDQAAGRGNSTGYDEALRLLVDLREAAEQFKETQKFQERFSTWVRPHARRPALLKRLRNSKFTLPEAL